MIVATLVCSAPGCPEVFGHASDARGRLDLVSLRAEAAIRGWGRFTVAGTKRYGDFCPACAAAIRDTAHGWAKGGAGHAHG